MLKRRRKACGLDPSGWDPLTPDRECSECPGKVVHLAGDKLCVACHMRRSLCTSARTGKRTTLFAAEWAEMEMTLPTSLVRGFRPGSGCLCQRDDCFHVFLADEERKREKRQCVDCGARHSVRIRRKWYRPPPDGVSGGASAREGAAKRATSVGFAAQRRPLRSEEKRREAASTWIGLGVEERPQLDPAVKLREMVLSAVGRGKISFREDVVEWMSDGRRKAGYDVREGKCRRNFVRGLFNDIAESPVNTARVVCGDGESLGVGDAHRRLFLFPKNVPDEVVAKYVLRARDARADVMPSSPTTQ